MAVILRCMGAARIDRGVLQAALARDGGRLRRRTELGYAVVAGRLCELVLTGALVSDRGVARPSGDAVDLSVSDLSGIVRDVAAYGGVPWEQLFWNAHADVLAAYRESLRWLIRQGMWRRRLLTLSRRYIERDGAGASNSDSGNDRVEIADAIVDIVDPARTRKTTTPTRSALPTVAPAQRRAVLDVLAGLASALTLARRGGRAQRSTGDSGFGTPGFTGVGT